MGYFIKKEPFFGKDAWMIYYRLLFFPKSFIERCNTPETAELRLKEIKASARSW